MGSIRRLKGGKDLKKFHNMTVFGKTGKPLEPPANPVNSAGQKLPFGSCLDTKRWPLEVTPTEYLAHTLDTRGLHVRKGTSRKRLLARCKHLLKLGDAAPQPLPIAHMVTCGEYSAFSIYEPVAGREWLSGDEAFRMIRGRLRPISDEEIDKVVGYRPSIRSKMLQRVKSGHCSVRSLRCREVKLKATGEDGIVLLVTCVPSLRDTVKHMSNDVYTTKICFVAAGGGKFEFKSSPYSSDDCPKGQLICSHIGTTLLVVGLIQAFPAVDAARFAALMPENVREVQRAGITAGLAFGKKKRQAAAGPARRASQGGGTDEVVDPMSDDSDADSEDEEEYGEKEGDASSLARIVALAKSWFETLEETPTISKASVAEDVRERMRQIASPSPEATLRRSLRLLRYHDAAKQGHLDHGTLLSMYALKQVAELRKFVSGRRMKLGTGQRLSGETLVLQGAKKPTAGGGVAAARELKRRRGRPKKRDAAGKLVERESSAAPPPAKPSVPYSGDCGGVAHHLRGDARARGNACVCGIKGCSELCLGFLAANDMRGDKAKRVWSTVPPRWRSLLRTEDNEKSRELFDDEDAYIAYHHFHPAGLGAAPGAKRVKEYVSREEADAIWPLRDHERDKLTEEERKSIRRRRPEPGSYRFVPSYPINDAKENLRKLAGGGGGRAAAGVRSAANAAAAQGKPRTGGVGSGSGRPQKTRKKRPANKEDSADGMMRSLQAALKESAHKLAEKDQECASLRRMVAEMKVTAASEAERRETEIERAMAEEGGFSRRNVMSDRWHKMRPGAANTFLNLGSWRQTKAFMKAMFGDDMKPPAFPRLGGELGEFTPFEKAVVAKMSFTTGMTQERLAVLFGVDRSQVSRYIDEWAPLWGELGEDLSQLNVSVEYAAEVYPDIYTRNGYKNVFGIVDGKDFMSENCASNSAIGRAMYSNKTGMSSFRVVTWTMPDGTAFLHSPLFLGRLSEKRIMELMEPLTDVFPAGWCNLGDRGFAKMEMFFKNFNLMLTPKFLGKRAQFSATDINHDLILCKLRYTCEVAFSRLLKESALMDVIRSELFPIIEAMVSWGHAMMNLAKPLKHPKCMSKQYFESNPALFHLREGCKK